jgi:hypothetical protein
LQTTIAPREVFVTVPAPSIALAQLDGGVQFYSYEGQIGVAGLLQNLNIDLTAIPALIRADPFFADQVEIKVQALATGISFFGPSEVTSADFTSGPNQPNEYLTVQVSSDLVTRQISLLLEIRHTYTR